MTRKPESHRPPETKDEDSDLVLARQEGREALTPWVGWFLAPMAWALHQGGGYAMAPWLCEFQVRWPYHVLTAVVLTMCAAGFAAALHALRRGRRVRPHRSAERLRMMALVGFMLCAAACGGIVVEYAGSFWIDLCTGV